MIYVHVPFCRSFCTYCGFYSETVSGCGGKSFEAWTGQVCEEASRRTGEILATKGIDTLYFGGGTPSLLSLDCIDRILEALPGGRGHRYSEFTLECNPDDISRELCRALAGAGVNRISMGVQSFDDGVLRWMNRRHDARGARGAFEMLRREGFDNISIDLIFGISSMDDALWRRSIEEAVALSPEHISAYQLSVEPGSALAGKVERGEYREAPDSQCARQYELLCGMLSDAGYSHYEVSNFALPGHESIHNSAYWKRVPYVGLGPGAHSFDGDRTRLWNSEELSGWSASGETLGDEDMRVETLMLGLRTAAGLDAQWIAENCDGATVSRLLGEGALAIVDKKSGTRLRIPENHFFVSDEIIRELI